MLTTIPERHRGSDRFEDAKDYYDFLLWKKLVRFHAHPTRCDPERYPPFDLIISSKITYDKLAEKVGDHLGVDPTHLRLTTVNSITGNPRNTIKRGQNQSLQQILQPTFGGVNGGQRSDALYFEVLDMSLAELETKKTIKLVWLSEGITKEVCIFFHNTGRDLFLDN